MTEGCIVGGILLLFLITILSAKSGGNGGWDGL